MFTCDIAPDLVDSDHNTVAPTQQKVLGVELALFCSPIADALRCEGFADLLVADPVNTTSRTEKCEDSKDNSHTERHGLQRIKERNKQVRLVSVQALITHSGYKRFRFLVAPTAYLLLLFRIVS